MSERFENPLKQYEIRRTLFTLSGLFDILANPDSPFQAKIAGEQVLNLLPAYVRELDTGCGTVASRKIPGIPEEHQEYWTLDKVNSYACSLANAYGLRWKKQIPTPPNP